MKKITTFMLQFALATIALPAIACQNIKQLSVDLAKTAHETIEKLMFRAGYMLYETNPLDPVMKQLDGIEKKMQEISDKADAEIKNVGKVAHDTQTAIDALGTKQRELADEILAIKQRGGASGVEEKPDESWGAQFVKSESYQAFQKNDVKHASFEVKNTVTNTVGNTFSDRREGIVGGAARVFTLEQLLNTLPTSSNAVDYVRENVFANNAAETAEGSAMPETNITTTLVSEPVATIGHWLKISEQLAADSAALAAYINARLIYGVNLRVENQIINGNGASGNMSGFIRAGNFTPHGYTAAALTALGLSATNRFDVIGKTLGDCQAADYPADAIILNPGDWWTMRLAKDSQGRYILGDPGMNVAPALFGTPVVASNAVTADNFVVASLAQAATFYNRQTVAVDLSPSDSDNFVRNLITVRAVRRCLLAVERPAAVRYGDLTPA